MALATAVDTGLIDKARVFHGELCPGLATGIQVARLAMRELGELTNVVAVAETDMCGVDAVQALSGCTIGNRNLIVLDYGKIGFQFFKDGSAIRISGRHPWSLEFQAARRRMLAGTASDEERRNYPKLRDAEVDRILSTPLEELFTVREFNAGRPLTSTVDPWLICDECGEEVMESRVRYFQGRELCIPDYHRITGRS
jgi:formylmethanofuran dehydrogenase subunit E